MENCILYSEINVLCIVILALLSIKVFNSMFLKAQKHWFFWVAFLNCIFLGTDSVWIFIDNNVLGVSVAANWLVNIAYYVLSGMLGYCWFAYSETVQESRLMQDKHAQRLAALPIVLLVVLTLISVKTGWLFYIDEHNRYQRGPAYALQLLTSYGYVIFTAGKALYLSRRTDDYHRKHDLRTLATFVLPTILTGILQVFYSGYPILCIGNTVGILYVYLTMQEQLVSVDALTKLNNRNQLYQYLSGKLSHVHENKSLYLLIMDIDYFKSINDKYGHIEGDQALKLVAKAMRKACGRPGFFLSRFGGDEFIVICELDADASVDEVCENIHAELRKVEVPYSLTMSIGYAKYTPGIRNQQEFIAMADKELYRVKQSRHSS